MTAWNGPKAVQQKYLDPLRLREIFLEASKHPSAYIEMGANLRVTVNWAESCESPHRVVMIADRSKDLIKMPTGMTGVVAADVRCRKCPPCLKARSDHWAHRALVELAASPRTWFWTLTFPAEVHTYLAFKHGDSFAAIANEESKLITKTFKRMRFAGKKFRYLLVTEKHASGFPHFHMLLHETSLERQFTSRDLNGTRADARRGIKAAPSRWWPYICNATLVGDKVSRAPYYVLKYASKDMQARIRASQKYGSKTLDNTRKVPSVGTYSQGAPTAPVNTSSPQRENPSGHSLDVKKG